MSRFTDHFRAEIFSEAFTKAFFSGPKGRLVAFVFMAAYALVKIAWAIILATFAIIRWICSKSFGSMPGNSYLSNLRTRREIRRRARAFGDSYENTDDGDWVVHSVSGTGFRSGFFKLELRSHAKSRAVRVFVSIGGERFEIDGRTLGEIAGKGYEYPNAEDFANVYENLRTRIL